MAHHAKPLGGADLVKIESYNTVPSVITAKDDYATFILVCTQYNRAPNSEQYYGVTVDTTAERCHAFSVIGSSDVNGAFGAGTFVFAYRNVSAGTTFHLTYKYNYGTAIVLGA